MDTDAKSRWEKVGFKHHHGINLPLFSLRSKKSCGIGEYPDLLPMIDWCQKIGFDVIQLLPLNDGGLDSSPYNAITGIALNPIHLGLVDLPQADQIFSIEELNGLQKMSESQRINYSSVREKKYSLLRKYRETEEYRKFLEDNPWLLSFALFKTLKIVNEWRPWQTWPQEQRQPHQDNFEKLLNIYQKEIDYHCFIQFLCFQQFSKIKNEAERKGIFIKGDIPILIDRESADVWFHKELFNLDYSAGAPPDMYSSEGQYWGFPLYHWDQIEMENYRWWKQRLAFASKLYHIYRIDHIVGFYRIWGIPLHKSAREGKFIPEDKAESISSGEKIMHMMLANSSMLPIGEDLGTVPPEVRNSLAKLGICGTKVMRWERNWEGDKNFIPPEDYPALSMTTVSTHDSDTLTLWWKNNPEEAKEYTQYKNWEYTPSLPRNYQQQILWDSHHSGSLFHINLLNEYLALVPGMTWSDPEDEKINFPGTFSERNWSYRFKPYVEEIVSNPTLEKIMLDVRLPPYNAV